MRNKLIFSQCIIFAVILMYAVYTLIFRSIQNFKRIIFFMVMSLCVLPKKLSIKRTPHIIKLLR